MYWIIECWVHHNFFWKNGQRCLCLTATNVCVVPDINLLCISSINRSIVLIYFKHLNWEITNVGCCSSCINASFWTLFQELPHLRMVWQINSLCWYDCFDRCWLLVISAGCMLVISSRANSQELHAVREVHSNWIEFVRYFGCIWNESSRYRAVAVCRVPWPNGCTQPLSSSPSQWEDQRSIHFSRWIVDSTGDPLWKG